MKMLYVLSPPHTPPPSPWTSMRDTSPPLSCPSSNSNSSSSINSSCSYSSSQSGRDASRNRMEKPQLNSSGKNCGSVTSTKAKLETISQKGRDSVSMKDKMEVLKNSFGDSKVGKETNSSQKSCRDNFAFCKSHSGGEIETSSQSRPRHFQWKKFESKSCENGNSVLPHICEQKIFPARSLDKGESHLFQSELPRRDSTLTEPLMQLPQKRDSTRDRVVCRSKQSKATRNWLNAIAKANARGTSGSEDYLGDDREFGEDKELAEEDGERREMVDGKSNQKHFVKNVKKSRLKRKDSGTGTSTEDEETSKPSSRRLSECYFAVALPCNPHPPRVSSPSSDIQKHLQSMFQVLRPQETLKMAVKLESVHPERTRYLVVVSCDEQGDESCLLGFDCNETTTVGLVLRVLADTAITLDGDGGFSVCVCGRQHIFKPVSVQAMWSALQSLHKVSSLARDKNYFLNGGSHEWVSQYEAKISSDRSCLNEWHAMDCLESRRPPSPSSHALRDKPSQRDQTEQIIRSTLKEIIMSVDLDEVTSKYIRSRLEDIMDSDLGEYKSFIDQEMLYILKQMDAATEIFPHVYLGSEWNASNLEELARNGVGHILNVTREIDNFFPGEFNYLNVRVYDDDETYLLKHWDDTYKYITNAKNQGSKVLVHCKMGISRSASVVIAYAMKAYNWDLTKAMTYVRQKRNCIKPNANFTAQLETYQGMLDAMKNRDKLQRSKSETNLKCNLTYNNRASSQLSRSNVETRSSSVAKEEAAQYLLNSSLSETPPHSPVHKPYPMSYLMLEISPGTNYTSGTSYPLHQLSPGAELAQGGSRPKSWSPDAMEVSALFETGAPTSQSLEHLCDVPGPPDTAPPDISPHGSSPPSLPTPASPSIPPAPPMPPAPRNVRMPCGNGLAYSVSQNKVLHLACTQSPRTCEGGVKSRVHALEANASHWSDRLTTTAPPTFLAQQIACAKQAVEEGKASRETQQNNKTSSRDPKPSGPFGPPAGSTVVTLTSQFSQPPSQSSQASKPPHRFARKFLKFICKEKSHTQPASSEEKILPSPQPQVAKNPATLSPSGKTKNPSLARQDSCSSADSAIVSDYVSRQGSWGSGELKASRAPFDTKALPPLCKDPDSSLGKSRTPNEHEEKSCDSQPQCACTSDSNSSESFVSRKQNRICNCFRRNSDGESLGQEAYTLGNPSAVGNTIESGIFSSRNVSEGNSDSRVADARGKFDLRGTKSYDNDQIMAASSCISSVILRKKFLLPTDTQSQDIDSQVPGPTGKVENVQRQGNSIFYVNNSHPPHGGTNARTTRLSDSSNVDAAESHNTLLVSIPPSRPLSQTLFNYSNSYPQPFSSSNKLKNNPLSRSYPSVLGNASLAAKTGPDTDTGCDRRSTGSSCVDRQPSQPYCDKESQGQMNLNRVAMTTSTQSLNSNSHKRECPKRSLSVDEKRGKKLSPAGGRKEAYGIVRNLKDEFEAKNIPGLQHKRNHSSSSCCSCDNTETNTLDNSAPGGNINNLCDEEEVFRVHTNAHEDNSNNNEAPGTRRVKKIPRPTSSAGIPTNISSSDKKSVRNIVGKFEQKSDAGPKTVVVDSVTNFIKYIDDIKTKREEGSMVDGRVLVDAHTTDSNSGVAPPIYNTM